MKVGDEIKFNKLKWKLVRKRKSFPALVEWWEYRSYRKYFHLWLKYTEKTYCIFPERWNRLKKKVAKNKKFYPSQLYYL